MRVNKSNAPETPNSRTDNAIPSPEAALVKKNSLQNKGLLHTYHLAKFHVLGSNNIWDIEKFPINFGGGSVTHKPLGLTNVATIMISISIKKGMGK